MRTVARLSSLGTDPNMKLETSQLKTLLDPPSPPLTSHALLVNCHNKLWNKPISSFYLSISKQCKQTKTHPIKGTKDMQNEVSLFCQQPHNRSSLRTQHMNQPTLQGIIKKLLVVQELQQFTSCHYTDWEGHRNGSNRHCANRCQLAAKGETSSHLHPLKGKMLA